MTSPEAIGDRLAEIYRDIHMSSMRDVPICNDALSVEALGFQTYADHVLGVVITPWFLNLILAGTNPDHPLAQPGETIGLRLPAGRVEFSTNDLPGFGVMGACSLFSPMEAFATQEVARETAVAVLAALFNANLHETPPAPPRGGMDRRAFFGARRMESAGEETAS